MIYSCVFCFFFFKQKTAYEMRISDWSSDVCSSDLSGLAEKVISADQAQYEIVARATEHVVDADTTIQRVSVRTAVEPILTRSAVESVLPVATERSEERRVGKEWVRTCRSGWSQYHNKKQKTDQSNEYDKNTL